MEHRELELTPKIEPVRLETHVKSPRKAGVHRIRGWIREMLRAEAGVDTLDARLSAERRDANATCIWEMVFCACARRP